MDVLMQGAPLMGQSLGGAFVVDMGIQLVGWAFAAALKTEKFYDLCGSLAFASTAALTFASSGGLPRQVLATSMVWGGGRFGRGEGSKHFFLSSFTMSTSPG